MQDHACYYVACGMIYVPAIGYLGYSPSNSRPSAVSIRAGPTLDQFPPVSRLYAVGILNKMYYQNT